MMEILTAVERRGTCPRRRVGCVITDDAGRIISTGYNGAPPGESHCIDTPCPGAKEEHGVNQLCEAIHAEQNALLQGGMKLGFATRMYCSATPCINCAKLLLCTGIKTIVVKEVYSDKTGMELLKRRGVEFFVAGYCNTTNWPAILRSFFIHQI